VNTKKEVKFWNRGRNLERSKDGRKYCYAPNLDCYLLRTPWKQFAPEHFYGEITVSLLWHLKSPEYIQQLSPESTKLFLILRDPVSIVVAWIRKRGTPLGDYKFIIEKEITSWQNCMNSVKNEVKCAYMIRIQDETSYIVSATYYLFLQNWLSYLPLSRFIFVPASKLRCSTEEVMLRVFDSIGVSPDYDLSKLNSEINVNTNPLGKFSEGYGNVASTMGNSMGAKFTRKKKGRLCVPYDNLQHINAGLKARLDDFFMSYTARLGVLLGIPVEELY
jgi:hypothetical protein